MPLGRRPARREIAVHLPHPLEDIEAICALVHAGQAKAVMQVVVDPLFAVPQPGAVATEITPSGWLALEALMAKGRP